MSIGFSSSEYLRVADPDSLQYSSLVFQTNNAHTNNVNSLKRLNDTHLASGSSDCTIKIWNLEQGTLALTISTLSEVNVIESLNNGMIAGGMMNYFVGIWEINNGSLVTMLTAHSKPVFSLKLLSNGDLATGSNDNYIKFWDLSTFIVKYSVNCFSNVKFLLELPNKSLASAGGSSRNILIWNLTTQTTIATVTTQHLDSINALELLPNEDLVSASDDFKIKVWDAATFAYKYDLNEHTDKVKALKLISDELLASGSKDQKVKIWNVTSRERVKEFSFNATVNSIELLSKLFYCVVILFFNEI